jgi:hypothetical protein
MCRVLLPVIRGDRYILRSYKVVGRNDTEKGTEFITIDAATRIVPITEIQVSDQDISHQDTSQVSDQDRLRVTRIR